jgi:putative restriction endonuclease
MRFLLSIKTVFPKPGGKVWYDDQREVHRQIFEGDETIDYAFMGRNPDAADNRWLREAFENQVPLIYFLGIAPGHYQATLPAFISGWDGKALKARVAFGAPDQETLAPPETALDRRYALRAVKQRLHQASFREAVITAYSGRCAVSGLLEPLLLDAAHIVADSEEKFGQPVVPNGIPLSKIHHAAFDAHLIGIDPDWQSFAAQTSIVPFAAIAAGRTRFNPGEIAAWRWVAAVIAYALMLGGHSHIIGVSPFPA